MTIAEAEARIKELTAERDEALGRLRQCEVAACEVFGSSIAMGSGDEIPMERRSDDYKLGFVRGNGCMASRIVVITLKKEPVNA